MILLSNAMVTTFKQILGDMGYSAVSLLFVLADVHLEDLKDLDLVPNWLSILVVLSVVFLNVARGIAVLRNKKDKDDAGKQK